MWYEEYQQKKVSWGSHISPNVYFFVHSESLSTLCEGWQFRCRLSFVVLFTKPNKNILTEIVINLALWQFNDTFTQAMDVV